MGPFGSETLCEIPAVSPELWRWPLNIDNDGSAALQWVGIETEPITRDHFCPTFFWKDRSMRRSYRYAFPHSSLLRFSFGSALISFSILPPLPYL